jgi:hypothetical protein
MDQAEQVAADAASVTHEDVERLKPRVERRGSLRRRRRGRPIEET